MLISERLDALRSQMVVRGITVYIVPTADFHESEYVGEHFKARKFITGFSGSAGGSGSLRLGRKAGADGSRGGIGGSPFLALPLRRTQMSQL